MDSQTKEERFGVEGNEKVPAVFPKQLMKRNEGQGEARIIA